MRVRCLARTPPGGVPGRPATAWLAVCCAVAFLPHPDATGEEPAAPLVAAADDDAAPQPDDDAVALPENRALERTFDRFARLVAESRWSDAAALCDEILAAPHDVLVRPRGGGDVAVSLKGETTRLLRAAPRSAREAYELLFGAAAERSLAEAIAEEDADGVQAVARRWSDTPAGRDAAVIAALAALECGRPALAIAWLDGLLAAPGIDAIAPTLRAMRAAAADPATAAGRATGAAATRPLLVPRYRVPLVRDPAEAGMIEQRRRLFAARDVPLIPAGTPLVVDGTVLVRVAAGILAVDLDSGRRRWLEPTAGDTGPTFDDATLAPLVACAGNVVALEATRPADDGPLGRLAQAAAAHNALVARDLATGRVRWRLPRAVAAPDAAAWHLGPPLAVDDALHVLVEQGGEVRLDVIDAATGSVRWSQPLATLEDHVSLAGPEAAARRRAGFTPALAEGVLVCPVGAGAVMAVDVASRRLLWSARYPTTAPRPDAPALGGFLFQPQAAVADERPRLARDGRPVIAEGRVVLAPPDGDAIVCLDLRTGAPAWREPPRGRWLVAGAADDRVVALGERAVEAFDVATGRGLWSLPHARAGGRPSGRGILAPAALLLPVDAPAVVEISLADGSVAGRSAARRTAIPGTLVACDGAIVSRGADSLDVFHQSAALDTLVRAASSAAADDPWALRWGGHLAIDRGDVAGGLAALRRGLRPTDAAVADAILADAILAGMPRDFAAAAATWSDVRDPVAGADVARAVLAGMLARGDVAAAWREARDLVASPPCRDGTLVRDPADPALAVHPDRWLAGRVAEIASLAPATLRAEIDAAAATAVAAVSDAAPDAVVRLESLAARLGLLPAGRDARDRAVTALDARIAAGADTSGWLALRREFHLLALARDPYRGRRGAARAALGRPAADDWAAWPLGAVALDRARGRRSSAANDPGARTVPVPIDVDADALGVGIRLACDVEDGRLVVRDRLGRWLTEPLLPDPAAGAPRSDPTWWIQLGSGHAASCVGRLLVVRLDGGASAFDLAPGPGGSRVVWSRPAAPAQLHDAAGMLVRSVGGRISRSGALPLGAVIAEADDPAPTGTLRGGRARHSGVLIHDGVTLALLDPCSGAPLWERQPLPQAGELVGDDEFVCVATAGGRDSLVLSMQDGRVVGRTALPPLRERLGDHGRRIVAARPVGLEPGAAVARVVRLELHDAASGEVRLLGEVPGEARGMVVGDDRLVVLDPDGSLAAFDLDRGAEAFRARLDGLPAPADFLHVLPLADRLLVVAGSRGRGADQAADVLDDAPLLQQLEHSGAATPPLWGGIWALDRSTGEPLWPVPVRLDGHCVATAPPAGLPLVVCSRPVHAAVDEPGGPRLGLVCLDARTGHAVVDEEPAPAREPLMGLEVRGDPATGAVLVREVGGPGRSVVARFTGAPAPPRAPYRAARRTEAPVAEPGPLDRARRLLVPDE